MLNCSVILEESAREYADKAAVVCTSTRTRMTHKQLVGKINQLVNGLRKLGIKKGDKVLVVCPNRIEFPVVFFALLKLGAVMVPVNILSKRSELTYYLSDTKAKALLCFQGSGKLPAAEEGWATFNEIETCEKFILITRGLGDSSPYEGMQRLKKFSERGERFEHPIADFKADW